MEYQRNISSTAAISCTVRMACRGQDGGREGPTADKPGHAANGDPNVDPIFKLVVMEPSPDEKVIVVKLSDDNSIRIWGNVFNDPHVFAFDFINIQGEHIRTPPDVKIYSDGPGPFGEVLSMEHLCQWPGPTSSNTWPCDPNEETYLIAEGSKIRIVRPGNPDCHLTIPSRRPRDGRYVAMPEYW
ncbi:hypothetical protein BD779DRAFT_1208859 [Infundibulicybe gibba]|nr:hypothetical protein BD779DRAFT_1208859 [Infundibulicybe gibba]